MKNKQTLNTMFWLKKSKATQDGRAPLYCRITIEGSTDELSLSCKANPKYWNTKLKRDTESCTDAKNNNLKISEIELDLSRKFIVLQQDHENITALMLKNFYLGLPLDFGGRRREFKPEIVVLPTILGAFKTFIKSFEKKVEKKLRSAETLRHWRSTERKVAAFIKSVYMADDMPLSAIQFAFAEDFLEHHTILIDESIQEVTAKGHLKKIKQILKESVSKRLIASNPIQDFSCACEEPIVFPLELFDVQKIYHKDLPIERLDEVRDAFIMQCFTGFAYQDIYGLTPEHIIRVGASGEPWLIKERGKTGVPEMVPILPIVAEIIEKYKNYPYCIKNNCLLPVNSNVRYNGYLKEIATICGLKRDLNTHLARHTFADIMLNNGVPLEDVSKMLGHKSLRTTVRYCRVQKYRISENVDKVRVKLFTKTGKLKMVS